MKQLSLSFEIHLNLWSSVGALYNFEGPQFHIFLHYRVAEFSTDEPLGIKNGVGGVAGGLVFGGIPYKTFGVSEGYIGGSGSVALIVRNDFYFVVHPYSHTGICRS